MTSPLKHPKLALSALTVCIAASAMATVHAAKDPTKQAQTFDCASPLIQTSDDPQDTRTLFTIQCTGHDAYALTPVVSIAGQLSAIKQGQQAPYLLRASYVVDARDNLHAPAQAKEGEYAASGAVVTSINSLADLPKQLSHQLVWNAEHNLLSVEERTGQWRVYSLSYLTSDFEPRLVYEGVVSHPMENGQATSFVTFNQRISQFAAPKDKAPLLKAKIVAREGKLEVQANETRKINEKLIQDALALLDRKPSDMHRAWALAAPARYLNRMDEVRYAEKKVAAFNPHLLEQFQEDVNQILPFALPR